MKKRFNILDFIISIMFALFLSFYFLPQGVNFVMNKKALMSSSLKQEILMSGKKYLQNNKEINSVSLEELINSGYLSKNNVFNEKGCFLSISTINKNNNSYNLNLRCISDESKLTLLE